MSAGDSNRTSSAGEPSAFFTANASRLLETAPLGPVLDLACGRGRHALAVAAMGLAVTAIDVNAEARPWYELDNYLSNRARHR